MKRGRFDVGDETPMQADWNQMSSIRDSRLRSGQEANVEYWQLIEIPLDEIVADNPAQRRRKFDPERFEEDRSLVFSIKTIDQRQPVCVMATGPQQYQIVWGHRRVAALRYLGRATVKGFLFPGSQEDAYQEGGVENGKCPLTPIEQAEQAEFYETLGYSNAEIAATLNVSERYAQMLKGLQRGDDTVRFALVDGKFSAKTAMALAQAPREHQPRLAEIAATQRWTEAEAKKVVEYVQSFGVQPDEAAALVGLPAPALPAEGNGHRAEAPADRAQDHNALPSQPAATQSPSGAKHPRRHKKSNGPLTAQVASERVANLTRRLNAQTARKLAEEAVRRQMDERGLEVATLLALSGRCPMPKAFERAEAVKDHPTIKSVLTIATELARLREIYRRGLAPPETGMCLRSAGKVLDDVLLLDQTTRPSAAKASGQSVEPKTSGDKQDGRNERR